MATPVVIGMAAVAGFLWISYWHKLQTTATAGATWWAPFTRDVVPEVRLADGVVVVDRPAEIED